MKAKFIGGVFTVLGPLVKIGGRWVEPTAAWCAANGFKEVVEGTTACPSDCQFINACASANSGVCPKGKIAGEASTRYTDGTDVITHNTVFCDIENANAKNIVTSLTSEELSAMNTDKKRNRLIEKLVRVIMKTKK